LKHKVNLIDFVEKIVEHDDPYDDIWEFLVSLARETYKSASSVTDFYEKYEARVATIERWLYGSWGIEMYRLLVEKSKLKANVSILKALELAEQINGNVLIGDGFSIREAIVLSSRFKDRMRELSFGIAPPPTVTSESLNKQLGESSIAKLIEKGSITIGGRRWRTNYVDPSRIGGPVKASDTIFITDLPDAVLHVTIRHGRKTINEDAVVNQLCGIIEVLSELQPLVITGDHGYLYLNLSPNIYMWSPVIESPRYGSREDVKGNEERQLVEVDNKVVVVGRYHLPSRHALIAHGGVSLLESLVPILVVH